MKICKKRQQVRNDSNTIYRIFTQILRFIYHFMFETCSRYHFLTFFEPNDLMNLRESILQRNNVCYRYTRTEIFAIVTHNIWIFIPFRLQKISIHMCLCFYLLSHFHNIILCFYYIRSTLRLCISTEIPSSFSVPMLSPSVTL